MHVPTCTYMYQCTHVHAIYLLVWVVVGWVIYLSFLSVFLKPVCYAHVFPCMLMIVEQYCMASLSKQDITCAV